MEEYQSKNSTVIKISDGLVGESQFIEEDVPSPRELPVADVQILTSGGLRIAAHASILVCY